MINSHEFKLTIKVIYAQKMVSYQNQGQVDDLEAFVKTLTVKERINLMQEVNQATMVLKNTLKPIPRPKSKTEPRINWKKEFFALKLRVEQLEKENAALRKENAALRKENAALKLRIVDLEARLAKYEKENNELRLELADYKTRLAKYEKENNELRLELADYKTRLAKYE